MQRIGMLAAAAAAATATTTVIPATAVAAGDRPTNVAFVRAWDTAYLHRDGSITVGAGLRCVPGWTGVELDIHIAQGTSYGDSYIVPSVPCDDAWHPSTVTVTDFFGRIHPGPVTINSQFLVTNDVSGDSAGAHQANRPAKVLRDHARRGHH